MAGLTAVALVVVVVSVLRSSGVVSGLLDPVAAASVRIPMPPDTWPGWKLKQRDDRFNEWLAYLQFHLVPNFTEVGFQIVDVRVRASASVSLLIWFSLFLLSSLCICACARLSLCLFAFGA